MTQKDTLHSFLETLSGPEKGVFEFLIHLDQKEKHPSSNENVIVSWGDSGRRISSEQLMNSLAHSGSVAEINGMALTWMEIHQGEHQSLASGSTHLRLTYNGEAIIIQNQAGSMHGMENSCGMAFSEMEVPVALMESSGEIVYSNEAFGRLAGQE